jgi:hypothetical protein
VKKSAAHDPCAWARRNSLHDGPLRRGAGPRPERRACATRPGCARSPTSGSLSPGAGPARGPRDRAAADPQNGAGKSTSSSRVRDASEATSAASQGIPTSAPSAGACWRPRAAPDPAAAATAARPSAAAPPADDGAPRSPPPTQRKTSSRQPPEAASARPGGRGRTAPADPTDRLDACAKSEFPRPTPTPG